MKSAGLLIVGTILTMAVTVPAAGQDAAKASRPKPITLGKKTENISPDLHGAANLSGGATAVKVAGNTLTAVLTGVVQAHAYSLCHASGIGTVHLVQELHLAPANPDQPYVKLSLTGKVDGYLRTDHNGSACLRLASVTVSPACGGTAPTLAISPGCVAGGDYMHFKQEVEHPPLIMPAGDYVLEATFVVGATVDGIVHGNGEAVFKPGASGVVPEMPHNPFESVDRKDFGFTVTLKSTAP